MPVDVFAASLEGKKRKDAAVINCVNGIIRDN